MESKIQAIDTLNHNNILLSVGDIIHGANTGNDKSIVSYIDRMYQIISWVASTLN
jgi:hypothetical protein